jgi:hypothetical protein
MSQEAVRALSFATLDPGRRYRVAFQDCCVTGYFEDMFLRYETDDDGDPEAAVFEHARIETDWGPWTFTALEST